MKRFLLMTGLLSVFAAGSAMAQFFTLEDENSLVEFDAGGTGAYAWEIDGRNQLFQQWFWYRINGVDSSESRIDTLGFSSGGTTDTDFDGFADTLVLNYSGRGGLDVQLRFALQGGTLGSASSDMAEQIRFTNRTGSPMSISFFQYSDFDLNDTPGDDRVELVGTNAFRQTDPTGPSFSETVATPAPSAYQAGFFPTLLLSLDDGGLTNLTNAGGPLVGDVSWAFQWNFSLSASGGGSSYTISKDKNFGLIPAPGAAFLGLIGLSCASWARRRLA